MLEREGFLKRMEKRSLSYRQKDFKVYREIRGI